MSAITIERFEKRFGYSSVLSGPSVSVEARQCYVLFGANGAGCGLNVGDKQIGLRGPCFIALAEQSLITLLWRWRCFHRTARRLLW
jgi:hypothetical protein